MTKKAVRKTVKTEKFLCKPCYKRCIQVDPKECHLQKRAKITLEICTLAELQRLALKEVGSFLLSEPTAWDCAILPGLNYRPDNIWAFNKRGKHLLTEGSCKLDKGELSYVLILEILEQSIDRHAHRGKDTKREAEIREAFGSVPVGFVYVTIAHSQHPSAKDEDIFFKKDNKTGEYNTIEGREEAFEERILMVRDKLMEFYLNKSNATYWIGN